MSLPNQRNLTPPNRNRQPNTAPNNRNGTTRPRFNAPPPLNSTRNRRRNGGLDLKSVRALIGRGPTNHVRAFRDWLSPPTQVFPMDSASSPTLLTHNPLAPPFSSTTLLTISHSHSQKSNKPSLIHRYLEPVLCFVKHRLCCVCIGLLHPGSRR